MRRSLSVFAVVLCIALLFALSAAADVLVAGRASDVYAAEAYITSDTQVIVLAQVTEKAANSLNNYLTGLGAPKVIRCGFASQKKYTEANLKKNWKSGVKAYETLLGNLRVLHPQELKWYVDPADAELHAYVGQLLRQACLDAEDPTVRGTINLRQSGCKISTIRDLASDQASLLLGGTWMSELRSKWPEAKAPEIPDQPELNAEGFLNSGEFSYMDETQGVWYYVSTDLRVTVQRYSSEKRANIWYEADVVRREGSSEFLHTAEYDEGGHFAGRSDKVAQGWVLAVNSDYYQYRVNAGRKVGLIVRAGKLRYGDKYITSDPNSAGLPTLDNLMLKTDGSFTLYIATSLKQEDALAAGAYDVLSFGPILVKDGVWMQSNNTYHGSKEPRTVAAKISDNHYLFVVVEGRKTTAKGMSLDELTELMLVRGASDAINLDGGRTSCMYFMGNQINSNGSLSNSNVQKVSPRSQWEMLVIGDLGGSKAAANPSALEEEQDFDE